MALWLFVSFCFVLFLSCSLCNCIQSILFSIVITLMERTELVALLVFGLWHCTLCHGLFALSIIVIRMLCSLIPEHPLS